MMEFTLKPIIFDADTGGNIEHFKKNIRMMEHIGIEAVIIEDKSGLKKNSLFGNKVKQTLEDCDVFAKKVAEGKKALVHNKLMIFARIESLIVGMTIEHALLRAKKYVHAGADGIMIHSCQTDADEIIEFAYHFRILFPNIPLICIPTTYAHVHSSLLFEAGLILSYTLIT